MTHTQFDIRPTWSIHQNVVVTSLIPVMRAVYLFFWNWLSVARLDLWFLKLTLQLRRELSFKTLFLSWSHPRYILNRMLSRLLIEYNWNRTWLDDDQRLQASRKYICQQIIHICWGYSFGIKVWRSRPSFVQVLPLYLYMRYFQALYEVSFVFTSRVCWESIRLTKSNWSPWQLESH